MLGKRMIVGVALLAAGCSANERRDEGRATQAAIDNSAEATLVPAASPTPTPSASASATPTPGPSASGTSADATPYLGRWIGVEGMVLNVAAVPAGVTLDMQYDLDNRGTFAGTVGPQGIAFTRNGLAETLKPGDGAATGLKYLADKRDCLIVKSGEGYCRD
jgi:hypothetical protein